jgi:glycosyltransferase involved in cell wall biosynthesis
MGLDLVIRSMPGLKKKYAAIRFDIVGYGPAIPKLKVLVRTLGLRPIVAFHGLLAGGKKRASLFAHAGIGVAPFNTTILDARVKNADPMKLKEYMSYGIPVIVTDAISNAFKIQRSGGGIVIPYREDAFLRAVTILVGNTSHYADFRHKALHYALTFDWKIIYKKHLLRLGIS